MPTGREMYEQGPTGLTTIPTPQGTSLADMLRVGAMREHYQNQDELDRQRLEFQREQHALQQQQMQHQLFKDTYLLSQDPRMAANPDAQDALFGVLGKMAGVPELSAESMKTGRESLKELYKSALSGDPNKTADAYADLAVRVANPQDLEKVTGAFSQFDLVREKTEAVRVHRQIEEAKYNQLQDDTVQIEVGRKHYTPAAMEFRDALRGADAKEYQAAMAGIERMQKAGGKAGSPQAIQELIAKSKLPNFSKESSDQMAEAFGQKRQEMAAMADTSTKVLEDVNRGAAGMSVAGKAELKHRIAIGMELSDAYGKLEAWAADPFNREKLKAAKQAGQSIEERRQAMDKLQTKTNLDAVNLRQQAFDMATQKGLAADFAQKQMRVYLTKGMDEAQAALKAAEDTEEKFPGVPYEGDKLKTSKPLVQNTINQTQEKAFDQELGKETAKDIKSTQVKARDAASIIDTIHQGRKLLDSGAITGIGATYVTKFGQGLQQLGFSEKSDAVANTQAFTSLMAGNVAKHIKEFGAGTGLSDADREYAIKMAGGDVTLDESSIRKILDINERAARNIIKLHNKSVTGVKSIIPLSVDEPSEYVKPSAKGGAGKPGNAVPSKQSGPSIKALPEGSKQVGTYKGKPVYQSPDGKKWIGD